MFHHLQIHYLYKHFPVSHLWLLERQWKIHCIVFPPTLEPLSRKYCCNETFLSSYVSLKLLCLMLSSYCVYYLSANVLGSWWCSQILHLKQEESDQFTALLGGLPTLSAGIKTGAFSHFTFEWLWETAETLKPPIQSLRNGNSSSQYLRYFPLPQGELRF